MKNYHPSARQKANAIENIRSFKGKFKRAVSQTNTARKKSGKNKINLAKAPWETPSEGKR